MLPDVTHETEHEIVWIQHIQCIEILLHKVLSSSQFILGHFYHCNGKMASTTWFRKR